MSPAEQAETRPMRTAPMHGKGRSDEGQDGGARAPPAMSHVAKGDALLTPRQILARMNITSSEPAKWMRRVFKKHGVPYLNVCGQTRATEEQYRQLMEQVTCSLIVPVGRTGSSISVVKSRLEGLIHRVLDSVRFDAEIPDRFGKSVRPREWFLVPLPVIDEIVARIGDGTLVDYTYDRERAALVPLA